MIDICFIYIITWFNLLYVILQQRKAKLELHKGYLDLQWSLEKDEMEDVIQEIIDWEWKLSASGYFYVNRGLASGVN